LAAAFYDGIVAVIIGRGQRIGAIVFGSLLLGIAQHVGVWKIGSQWQDAIAFAVLLLALVVQRGMYVRD